MPDAVLAVENLVKVYKPTKFFLSRKPVKDVFKAVDGISFSLKEGEILGLLGPNGAGKTTTIQMLLSILTPTSGTIHYFGKDFFHFRSESLQKVSHASAYNKLPGMLSVQENLEVYGRLYGLSSEERRSRIDRFLKFFEIEGLRNKSARSLSAGQITRVMLCKAFISHPKIVLLDEPTASLDPDIAQAVRQFILQQQHEYGVSIILTSHNMQEVAEVCGRVLVLQHGKILEEDTPQKLAKSISLSKVRLTVGALKTEVDQFLKENRWNWEYAEGVLKIDIDENQICRLLTGFALLKAEYSHIEIEKPSLEDYFLHISKHI